MPQQPSSAEADVPPGNAFPCSDHWLLITMMSSCVAIKKIKVLRIVRLHHYLAESPLTSTPDDHQRALRLPCWARGQRGAA